MDHCVCLLFVLNNINLIASVLFYAWGAPDFIIIVLGSIVVDFYVVKALYNSEIRKTKSTLLAFSVLINIGLLLYFKYANFFVENFNVLLDAIGFQFTRETCQGTQAAPGAVAVSAGRTSWAHALLHLAH